MQRETSIFLKVFVLACFAGLCFIWKNAMADQSLMNMERLNFSKGVIAKYGDKIPAAVQAAILAQKVIPGMPPYEASLAAGAYSFEVKPDPKKWPDNADPNQVLAAQSQNPDDSQITCIFENATQYPESGMARFKVKFVHGKAVTIEIMSLGRSQ